MMMFKWDKKWRSQHQTVNGGSGFSIEQIAWNLKVKI